MAGILDAITKIISDIAKNASSGKLPEMLGGKDYQIDQKPYTGTYTDAPVTSPAKETAESGDGGSAEQQGTGSAVAPAEGGEQAGLFQSGDEMVNSMGFGAKDEAEEEEGIDASSPFMSGDDYLQKLDSGKTQEAKAEEPQEQLEQGYGGANASQEALRARMEGRVSSDEEEAEEAEEDKTDGVDPSKFYKDGVFDYDAYQNELIRNMYDMDMFTFAYSATPEQYYELASDEMLRDLYAKEIGVDELTLDAVTDWVNAERAMRSVDDVVNAVRTGDFEYLTDTYGTADSSNLYNAILDHAATDGYGVYIPNGSKFNAESLYALDGRSEEDKKVAERNALGMEFLAWVLLNGDENMYATMSPEDVNAYTQAEGIEYGQAGQDGYAEATGELPTDWVFNPDYAMESYNQGWGYSGNRNMRDLIYDRLGYGWRTRQ